MTTTDRKTPSVQLTDDIFVSPRLFRLLGKLAENWGYSPLGFLEEVKRSQIESIRDDRHTRIRANNAGLTEEEYIQAERNAAPYVDKVLSLERCVYERMEAAASKAGKDLKAFIIDAAMDAVEKHLKEAE